MMNHPYPPALEPRLRAALDILAELAAEVCPTDKPSAERPAAWRTIAAWFEQLNADDYREVLRWMNACYYHPRANLIMNQLAAVSDEPAAIREMNAADYDLLLGHVLWGAYPPGQRKTL